MKTLIVFLSGVLLLTGSAIAQGRKRLYITSVDGDSRRYFVHEPRNYTGQTPRPLVFMLHGTTGNGNKFYNISGWKELGDTMDVLTVYPSSWEYDIIENGIPKHTTKWNCYPTSFTFAPGEVPRDDVKFLNQVLDEMISRYNVDTNRVYMAGFSNGAQMVARCAIEMGNRVAAVVEASGSFTRDTVFTAQRPVPVMYQVGNKDHLYIDALRPYGLVGDLPMSPDSLINQIPLFRSTCNTHVNTFGLDSNYTVNNYTTWQKATFGSLSGNANEIFVLVTLLNMDHIYPNRVNFPIYGAGVHWAWMRQFTLH